MNDLISRLSEIRSNYNCMDEKEEPYYRALSEAIQLVSAQPERTGRKMTNAEAIETLIANYPDACFEQLREAVDAAIEALKAQPKSEERTAESAQNVPNDELISKKAAIDAHCELCEDKGLCGDICPDVEVFRLIPSAQPTLCGYDIEHLKLIASVLQKENLPPERVLEALMDIGRIVSIVRDEFEETLRKAVEQCKI